jgi:hypothetical protein
MTGERRNASSAFVVMASNRARISNSDTWVRHTRTRINKEPTARAVQPVEYMECLKRALCRVTAYANRNKASAFARAADLKKDDDALFRMMERPGFQSGSFALFQYNNSMGDAEANLIPYDLASNFFYGSLSVEHAPGVSHKRITWTVTEKFLTNGYDGLHEPEYSPAEINPDGLPIPALLQRCCTNYFVRNLWHNYLHTIHHHINLGNYREFSGTSRHAMDFEADNWSNILLTESYGLTCKTNTTEDGYVDESIIRLLRQNKCNNLFSLRALERGESEKFSEDDLEHLYESEWRFRRTVAGYVSGWLIVSGVAAANISVHHRGLLSSMTGVPSRAHDGLVVSVNGVQIHITGTAGPRDHEGRKRLLKSIGGRVEAAYKDALRRDPDLKAFAMQSFNAMRLRLVP